ncbi:MAG: hypothetical protein V7765_00795 [Oleispira sp.]
MRSLKFQSLWGMTPTLILIGSIIFPPLSFAQELTAALSLRLGPGIGFPTNIELPSGTDVVITQRRNSWLLVVDDRQESGWAKISDVEQSGGLANRQAWRLTELKKKELGSLQGRWFANEQDYGLSLGWKSKTVDGHWLIEMEQATNTQTKWQALLAWYTFKHPISPRSYYSTGLGLGFSQENSQSNVFSEVGESAQTGFGGFELAIGIQPVKQVDTGLSFRYLLASSPRDGDSTVVSWYWSFGI